MKKFKTLALSVCTVAISTGAVTTTQAQDAADERVIEEVVTIGSRSQKPRTATDSPVPIDVFSGEEFTSLGNNADITDNLKTLVPSFTATPATGDGSAFIRPTSLRGMAPDQTLVLVNGKRRHRSALVQFFAPAAGNGAHGVDIGMIPSIGLKSVEVLRDGAAAQYGSDAIAGVMNFQMKDADEGGQVQVQYGEFFEGEESTKIAANGGFSIGGNGFINISAESYDNDALSRGDQRPDGQALVDAGVPGVGSDSPFDDAPFVQSWGRPETSGIRFFVNTGYDLNATTELYAHVGYGDTEGRYRFFYRNPSHSTLANVTTLPAGYTPFLDGDQKDTSIVAGVKGEFANEIYYDISAGYGKSELDYFLNNTINSGLVDIATGTPGQRGFNMGGYEQEEINLNADFSKALSSSLNLGFGAEWREETFTTVAGEFNAYGVSPGPSGMTSVTPSDAGEFDRDNFALYADLEQDISDEWLMQYALRYEDFSDFGSTVNGKIATRYRANDFLTFRAAVSTGFHAPTPGQANVSTIITTFDGSSGLQIEEGLLPPTNPVAVANGGKELKEEESINYSFGFTAELGDKTSLTVDYYLVEVDDRIYRTGDIPTAAGGSISFYTNALELKHRGFDVVLTSSIDWSVDVDTDLTFAFSYNQVDVVDQALINGITPVNDGLVEDIENNYPNDRFVLSSNTHFNERLSLMLRANYYGKHYDERGRIDGVDGGSASALIDDTIYVDLELNYELNENIQLSFGGANIFDKYVEEIGPENANRIGVGLPYPRRTAANYEGGSWYLRGTYNF
ncbi:MAG: iron complex outermembrane receptor protein [Gammaproteobacteria bacterium]|jgi:iron complex outermembrane receptor protein